MSGKVVNSTRDAIAGLRDDMTIMVGGFGLAGSPPELLAAVFDLKVRNLTVIANNAGHGDEGLAALVASGAVRKIICSFPRFSAPFEERYRRGDIELELVPQGTLSERIRAGGAGIGAFYTPTGVGTGLAQDKETRTIEGRDHVLEFALRADFSLLHAKVADRMGNLLYNKSARNYNPTMAMAANVSVVEVETIVASGKLDPEAIVTPGIFIDRIYAMTAPS